MLVRGVKREVESGDYGSVVCEALFVLTCAFTGCIIVDE